MNETISIRMATSADVEKIWHLAQVCTAAAISDEATTEQAVATYMGHQDSEMLLAERGARLVGVLGYARRPDLYREASTGLIEELIIHPDINVENVGNLLLASAMTKLKAAGCGEISVTDPVAGELRIGYPEVPSATAEFSRLRKFSEAIADLSFIIDAEGYFQDSFCRRPELLFCPEQSVMGRRMSEVLPLPLAETLMREISLAIETGTERRREYELEVPLGRRRFEARIAPMDYQSGQRPMVAMTVTDVTVRRGDNPSLQRFYERRRCGEMLADIVAGRPLAAGEPGDFFRSLGLELNQPLICCFVCLDLDRESQGRFARRESSRLQFPRDRVVDELNREEGMIAWDCGEGIGVLINVPVEREAREFSLQVAANLRDRLLLSLPELVFWIGVSGDATGLEGIIRCRRQAGDAALVARTDKNVLICHFAEIGLFQILARLREEPAAVEFVTGMLAKLLLYDQEKDSRYVNTLEAILTSSNLKEAAAKMFVHHKTILFRKRRIESLLGASLEDFETRMMLAAAIRLMRLTGKLPK